MAAAWDQMSIKDQLRAQNTQLKLTVLQQALGHVPYVRNRFAALGMDARLFKGLGELRKLPTTMRRDIVDPVRNPDGVRGVMLRGTAEGVKRFSDRSVLRRVTLARLLGGEADQELAIEAATRAIHVHLVPGPGGRIPVGYTRDDLDLFARAGARLGSVLGLQREDRLLNAVPFGPTLDFWGIFYMAHGMGMSAVHVRREGQELARALAAFDEAGITAVTLPADEATTFPRVAVDAGVDLSRLNVLVAVGRSLTVDERAELGEALEQAGAGTARIATAYGVAEGRVLWGECSVPVGRTETFGYHTYPDLEIVEVVSPETAEPLAPEQAGEIVVTPLGFRGSGVPRWRSGDLALGGLTLAPCPNCGRTVPRVGPSVQRAAWQAVANLEGKRSWIDLRDAAAAASERAREWQVELAETDGTTDLFVYLDASPSEPAPVIDLYEDLRRVRSGPTQIVLATPDEMRERIRTAPGPWPRYLHRTEPDGSPQTGQPQADTP